MYVFRIKEIRESKNISQYMLAKKSKISRSYIIELENGNKDNPTLQVLSKIAEVLNVNIKELFYTIDDIEPLKRQLDLIVKKSGILSDEAINLDNIIDSLLNLQLLK